MRRFLSWLTGGRPMTYVGHAFLDVVVGKQVYYWRDHYGREWLAYHSWSWFRMPRFSPNGGTEHG